MSQYDFLEELIKSIKIVISANKKYRDILKNPNQQSYRFPNKEDQLKFLIFTENRIKRNQKELDRLLNIKYSISTYRLKNTDF